MMICKKFRCLYLVVKIHCEEIYWHWILLLPQLSDSAELFCKQFNVPVQYSCIFTKEACCVADVFTGNAVKIVRMPKCPNVLTTKAAPLYSCKSKQLSKLSKHALSQGGLWCHTIQASIEWKSAPQGCVKKKWRKEREKEKRREQVVVLSLKAFSMENKWDEEIQFSASTIWENWNLKILNQGQKWMKLTIHVFRVMGVSQICPISAIW